MLNIATNKKYIIKTLTIILLTFSFIFFVQISYLHAFAGRGVRTNLYHSYDGLVCYDCHTMHNMEDGEPIKPSGPYPNLLVKSTVTDICLGCHHESGAWAFTAPIIMTFDGDYPKNKGAAMPAGDFYWSRVQPGNGHNPGKSFGNQSSSIISDPILSTAPGGTFSTDTNWDCDTCHGSHDRFGKSITAWRQIKREINGIVHTGDVTGYGVESDPGDKAQNPGYEPLLSNSRGDIQGTNYINKRADGQPIDGANLFISESNTNHNVYRGGFSSLCSICHGAFHGGTETNSGNGGAPTSSTGNTADGVSKEWIRHPTNVPLADDKYNAAKYTVVVTNTQGTNPNPSGYDYKYPLIRVSGTWTTGNAGTVSNDDKVTCLSCHYAHAGRDANALRWDAKTHAAFIANGATDGYGYVSNGDNPAYGCNKCHQKGGAKAFIKGF